jgi:hypothetical protein
MSSGRTWDPRWMVSWGEGKKRRSLKAEGRRQKEKKGGQRHKGIETQAVQPLRERQSANPNRIGPLSFQERQSRDEGPCT